MDLNTRRARYQEFTVKWASGQVNVNYPKLYFDPYKCYNFIFRLHPSVKLNITFYTIYFFDNTLNCNKQNVTISHYTEPIFCGQMSTFSFYPETKDVVVYFLTIHNYGKPPILRSMFAIIDKDLIINIPTSSTVKIKPDLLYMVHYINILQVYFIQVRKIRHIVISIIKTDNQKYMITDGPEISSTYLDFHGNIAVTSTFQCTVQVLTIQLETALLNNTLKYISKEILPFNQIKLRKNITMLLTLPFSGCDKNYCFLALHVINGYQINATLLNLAVKNENKYKCTYLFSIVAEELSED